MSFAPQPGIFVFSLDVPAAGGRSVGRSGRPVSVVAHAALESLAAARCPATWNLGDADAAQLVGAIRAANAEHELGMWGDAAWAGSQAPRSRVALEVKRHIELARAAGCAPTSLAVGGGQVTAQLDLLVKHGITAVRSTAARSDVRWWRRLGGSTGPTAAVSALRWGLWNFSGAVEPLSDGVRRTVRAIELSASRGGIVQVVVDLAAAAASRGDGLHVIERVLRHAAELAEQRRMVLQTVSQVAGRLQRKPPTTPARSILRRAA